MSIPDQFKELIHHARSTFSTFFNQTLPTHFTDHTQLADSFCNVVLDEILVNGRADKLIGIVDSASQGEVEQDQIRYLPIIRPGEILEMYLA
ncbi:hypothetical protein [Nitrosomonas marina]|uniref:hypothetical protein n=1 Tax=Nitrosomonas marina TaxID=917 RepID=UPI000B84C393|nr:hypothetical protein [Nitrosomonas marina]